MTNYLAIDLHASDPTATLERRAERHHKAQRTRKIMLRLTIDEMEVVSEANRSQIATATFIRDWLLKQSESPTPKVVYREAIAFIVSKFVRKLTFEDVLANFDAYVLGKEDIKSEFHQEHAATTREKHILLRFTDDEFVQIERLIPPGTRASVAIRKILVEQLQISTIPIPETVAFLVSALHEPASFDEVLHLFDSGPLSRKGADNEIHQE